MSSDCFFMYGLWFFPLLGFILMLVLIYMMFSRGNVKSVNHINNTSALDILKKGYAKGEITKEEFLDMKKEINS